MSQHTQIHSGICYQLLLACAMLALILISNAQGQTTQFTYQGRLTDAGNPANGQYDFQFKLFDSAAGTNQVGSTLTITNVTAVAGMFIVQLDFGAGAFNGAERWLELSVSPAGQNNFITLSPRQKLTSAPYSIQSLNASTAGMSNDSLSLGGVPASQYVQANDSRLSDARSPLPGSNDYVQNNSGSSQTGVNFNIGGTGSANILNAATQFNLGGNRVLSVSGGQQSNIFAGVGAGAANTTGFNNSFFGRFAGQVNTTGERNSFFGQAAGFSSTTGFRNSFFGESSGFSNSSGDNNTFVGFFAGANNLSGSGNTVIGASTGFGNGVLTNATAIGYRAQVNQSNSIVLGSILGVNLGTSNTNVGIGTTAPAARLHVSGDSEGIRIQGQAIGNPNGAYLSFADAAGTQLGYVGDGSSSDNSIYLTSYVADVKLYTQIGAALTATQTGSVLMAGGSMYSGNHSAQTFDQGNFKGMWSSTAVLGVGGGFDTILASPVQVCARVVSLGGGFGGYALVRCSSPSSSAMHKTEVHPFSGGLDIIQRLTPVSFRWKQDQTSDLGLNADEVAGIAPELVTRNPQGEAGEVKENALSVVFINAFKQQQKQIEAQQDQINKQQQQINALKRLVCTDHPNAEVCKAN